MTQGTFKNQLDTSVPRTNQTTAQPVTEKSVEETVNFLPPSHPAKSDGGFCSNLSTDKHLRHKYLHTVCVWLSFLNVGWRMSMTGPTLPDLRLIMNENLARASWIISALAFGGLIGSLITGTIYDRFNKRMTYMALTLCLSVSTVATPWCSQFAVMVAIHVLSGACAAGINTVVYADTVLVWGHKSPPFLQAMGLAFSIGAVISPLATEPFLAKHIHMTNITLVPTSASQVSFNDTILYDQNQTHNTITKPIHTAEYIDELVYGQTHVHWAYMISAAVSLLAFVSLVADNCFLGNVYDGLDITHSEHDDINNTKLKYPLSRPWRVVFVVILAITLSTYVIIERTWYSYLVTFLIEKLLWSKTKASNATTVFWIAFAVGRLLSIILVKVLNLTVVFTICLGLLLAGGSILFFAVRLNMPTLIWITCVLYGLGMSALFASGITWISVKVCPLTGVVSSIVYTIALAGAIVFPFITGDIMSTISYDWFIYLEIILTCFIIFLFVAAETLYRLLT